MSERSNEIPVVYSKRMLNYRYSLNAVVLIKVLFLIAKEGR